MLSMTGYGTSKISNPQLNIEVNLKTVNNRFLEVNSRLPRLYQPFEQEIKKRIQKKIYRGTVDIYIHRTSGANQNEDKVNINPKLAQQWMRSCRTLEKNLKLPKTPITIKDILEHTEAVTISHTTNCSATEKQQLFQQIDKAVAKCVQERQREGRKLVSSMKSHLDQLNQSVQSIEKLRGQVHKDLVIKQKARLKKLSVTFNADRMNQEIAFILDKTDIDEELVRLKSHINHFKKLLNQKEAHGKKLDFYTQEFLREVNTIGSKTQISEITRQVIESKSLIEKIKEQVKNIE